MATKKKSKKKPQANKKKKQQSPLIEKALDQALSKINPALRTQIEQLTKALENQQFDFKDIRFLGVKILQKANEVRKSLTKPTKKPAKTTRRSKKR
jgi:hypothetical protein